MRHPGLVVILFEHHSADRHSVQRTGVERLASGSGIERGAIQIDAAAMVGRRDDARLKLARVGIMVIKELGRHGLFYCAGSLIAMSTTLLKVFPIASTSGTVSPRGLVPGTWIFTWYRPTNPGVRPANKGVMLDCVPLN